MDFLTVVTSAALSGLVSTGLLFVFYRFWILPYLTQITLSVPNSVQELVLPYVDQKMSDVENMIDGKISQVTDTVKKSSASFQRTVNKAAAALDLDEIDLDSEDGQQAARDKLARSYGYDVAMQAVAQLIESIRAPKKPVKDKGSASTW